MIPPVARRRSIALNFELEQVVRRVAVDQIVQALFQHDLDARRVYFAKAEILIVFAWPIDSPQLDGFPRRAFKQKRN